MEALYQWTDSMLSGRNITATFTGEIMEGLSPIAVCRWPIYYPINMKRGLDELIEELRNGIYTFRCAVFPSAKIYTHLV
jgi:hypothetical protein